MQCEVCVVCGKCSNVFIMIGTESSRFTYHIIISLQHSAVSSENVQQKKTLPFLHKPHLSVVIITLCPNPQYPHYEGHYFRWLLVCSRGWTLTGEIPTHSWNPTMHCNLSTVWLCVNLCTGALHHAAYGIHCVPHTTPLVYTTVCRSGSFHVMY